jgi:hypothetical protein
MMRLRNTGNSVTELHLFYVAPGSVTFNLLGTREHIPAGLNILGPRSHGHKPVGLVTF